MYYAIIDCDNCYVSCERVFHPELNGKAVVVLSNNDGCVVARSAEAKQLGIRAGQPYYQVRQQFTEQQVVALSSNYELYGELTARVMSIIRQQTPSFFRYSIDEAFARFDDSFLPMLKQWGEDLHHTIQQQVGIPISTGIAATKTLAKIASRFAKRYPGYHHACFIESDSQREKALRLTDIDDVWGIGRRYAARLKNLGVRTAADFVSKGEGWMRMRFNNKGILRTWKELCGEDCIPNEQPAPKQSICTSRTFSTLLTDADAIRTHVANYAAWCAEKLRKQHSVAAIVSVFVDTNPFREDLPQHHEFKEYTFSSPTSTTVDIVKAAEHVLMKLLRPGYHYKRAGVIVMGITADSAVQTDMFDFNFGQYQKKRRLDRAIDTINKQYGANTLTLATQQYSGKAKDGKATTFADNICRDMKTKNPTTRWNDIITLK